MNQTAQVPLWVAVVIAVAAPVFSFLGVLLAQSFTRNSSERAERRLRREETMRMLRWAADLAASDVRPRAAVGIAALDALNESEVLDAEDQLLISGVLDAVVEPATETYDEGDEIEEGPMAKTIRVTRAQVRAARLIVERADRGIGTASAAVKAIAKAKPVTSK